VGWNKIPRGVSREVSVRLLPALKPGDQGRVQCDSHGTFDTRGPVRTRRSRSIKRTQGPAADRTVSQQGIRRTTHAQQSTRRIAILAPAVTICGAQRCLFPTRCFCRCQGSTHVPTRWCSSTLPLIEAPSHGGPARTAPPSGSQVLGDSREHSGALDGLGALAPVHVNSRRRRKLTGGPSLALPPATARPSPPQSATISRMFLPSAPNIGQPRDSSIPTL